MYKKAESYDDFHVGQVIIKITSGNHYKVLESNKGKYPKAQCIKIINYAGVDLGGLATIINPSSWKVPLRKSIFD